MATWRLDRGGWVVVAALVGAGAGAGCRGGRLGSEDASTIYVPDAAYPDAGAGRGTETQDAAAEAPVSVPDAGVRPPPAVCPTVPPARSSVPGGAAASPAACASGPTAAAYDLVIADGTRPAFHHCGTLGETATGITVSPDGRRLAVRAGEAVHLYDTADWRETARLVHASDPLDAAAFSPDGKRLAVVSTHLGQLSVWKTDDGTLLRVASRDPATGAPQLAAGAGVAFSSDGRRVVSALGTIVDVDTGATVQLAGNVRGGRNYAAWFLAGDRTVATLTQYHSGDSWVGLMLEQFDAQTGALLDTVGDHAVLSADQSTVAGRTWWTYLLTVERLRPDGSRDRSTYASGNYAPFDDLVAVSAHGEALLAHVGSAIEALAADDPTLVLSRIELPPGMTFVAMSPADEVVTAGPCGTVAWDWRTGVPVWREPFSVTQIAWDAGGALVAAIGPGALWRVWRTDTGGVLCTAPGGHAITRRVFSPDGGAVALTYDDGRVELRDADLANPRPLMLSGDAAGGQVVALGRAGARAVVWAGDEKSGRRLVLVDTHGVTTSPPLRVTSASAPTAFVSADGRRLAYKDVYDIRLIDLESGTVLLDDDQNDWLLGFDPDERRLAILTVRPPGPQTILTYAVADGAPAGTLVALDLRANFGALAPDWSLAVTSQTDLSTPGAYTTTRVPLAGGTPQILTTHVPLDMFSVSTDDALLFNYGLYFHEFTGDYMELNVIDAATGDEVQDFVDHALAPSADGRRLFGQAGAVLCR